MLIVCEYSEGPKYVVLCVFECMVVCSFVCMFVAMIVMYVRVNARRVCTYTKLH